MKPSYEFPDDPEVFERVLQHFRDTTVDYWEARIARYAAEAKAQSSTAKTTSRTSVSNKKLKATAKVAHARPAKRTQRATGQ